MSFGGRGGFGSPAGRGGGGKGKGKGKGGKGEVGAFFLPLISLHPQSF
jgi:hypothetical protein